MSTSQRTLFNSYAGPGSPSDLSIDSRFLPFLKDNDIPPSVVLRELNAEMKEPLQALVHIEAEIQELETALALLGRRRDGLRGAISVYTPILSPIRTLPDDVLQGIFVHCLPTSRNARPFTSEAPLLLTIVCKKWRTLAFASPRLWCTLHLPLDFQYNPRRPLILTPFSCSINPMIPLPRVAELHASRRIELEHWLQRSGALPLSISLFYSKFGGPLDFIPSSEATEIMDLIARYAGRISTLELDMPSHILRELGEKFAPYGASGSLPLLKRLRVLSDEMHAIPPSGQHTVHDDGFGVLSVAALQELSVRVAPSLFHTGRIHRFVCLTVLSLNGNLDVGVVQHILSQCSILSRCSLNIVRYDTDPGWVYVPVSADDVVPQPIQTTIRLEHLETLAIRGEIRNIGFLCRPFETPSMRHLLLYPYRMDNLNWEVGQDPEAFELELVLPYPPESTGDLCRYMSQCSSLQSLTINPDSLFTSEIQSIFQSVENISTLVLDNNFTGRPAAPRITQSSLNAPMFPTGPSSIITFGKFKYHLHPLLKQERVVKSTGQRTALSQPLLPNIKSFTWHQFSLDCIPNDFLVGFITSRLQPAVLDTEAGRIDYKQLASLKEINIKLLKQSDATDIGTEIAQFAQQAGLTPGSDFSLSITTYPWADRLLQPIQYAAPQVHSEPSSISEDNLIFNYDVTWPLFEI